MADVFISYAHADRTVAEALARDLTARGYSVWWDAELVGADDFYEVILSALQRAKAAIVIWSRASVKSRFVRDEARFALHSEKLIAVKSSDLDYYDIPFGFQGQHTDDVSNREQIFRAIGKLGIGQTATYNLSDRDIKTPERYRSYEIRALTGNNWQAFFAGITFQMPKFQLSEQGTWTSIGAAVAYSIVALMLVELIQTLDLDYEQNSILNALVFGVVAIFLWIRGHSFLKQRNFVAGAILSITAITLAAIAINTIMLHVLPWKSMDDEVVLYFVGIFAGIWIIFLNILVLQIRSYR